MNRPSTSVDSVDVQMEWNLFIKNLNQCFIGAYENLMLQPGLSDDHIHELAQRLKKPGRRAKGAIATYQWFQDACSRRGHPNPGEKIRKLRRSLARLFEVRRLVRQNIRPPENLLQKLWPTTHELLSLDQLLCLAQDGITDVQSKISSEETNRRNTRLHEWKVRINDPTLKGLASWVKRKTSAVASATVHYMGREASQPQEVNSLIHQYWTDLWRRSDIDVGHAANNLATDFGPTQQHEWQPLTLNELWTACRNAKGAMGPDGYSGSELKHMPLGAIEDFHRCSLRWWETSYLPKQFMQSRQINIHKPHKIVNGKAEVSDLRPLSVLSCFWRVYSSAWATNSQLAYWANLHFDERVAHGKGTTGAEELASRLQDVYATRGGYLASLDWAQAFDRMNPKITAQMMRQLHLAPPLADLLERVWGSQNRFLEFDSVVHHETLASHCSMPQGDPLSPFCLALWASAGLRHVDAAATNSAPALTLCYMDDRSMWSSSLDAIIERINIWSAWSTSVGLLESENKTQIVAKNERDRVSLQNLYPNWSKDQVTILGVSTTSKRRDLTPKEKQRIEDARRRAHLIALAPIHWSLKIRSFQSLVLSKAAYGWVGKDPLKKISEDIFSLLSVALDTGKGAARDLRKMFYGSITFLNIVVLTRRWGRIARSIIKDRASYSWNQKPFTSVNMLRMGLKKLGFKETGPWVWKPPDKYKKLFTGVRRLFKINHFVAWSNHKKRRDARWFRSQGDPAQQLKWFEAIDLPQTRKVLDLHGSHRAALMGSFMSPAAKYSAYNSEDYQNDICPLCKISQGTMDHVMWHCPANRFHHPIPYNPLQLRFGWSICGSPHNNHEVISHMAATIQNIWDIRHSNGGSNFPT